MLSDKEIIEYFDIKKVIKNFPPSGQKQVVLVEHRVYKQVILKIVNGNNRRVLREIEIVTNNNFKNVPVVLKVDNYNFENKSGIYILEEYIEGESLKNIIRNKKLSLIEAMNLMEQLLGILLEMEKAKVVHRDIKPDNIIKCNNGSWYLIDFGIARALEMDSLTMTEVMMGPHTPGYGAPELFQYSKENIDSRADLFSLGVVIFEAVTGRHPFIRGDEFDRNEIWYNTITVVPESIIIEGDFEMMFMGLIQTFMQKHIARRPKSVEKALEWYYSVEKEIMG